MSGRRLILLMSVSMDGFASRRYRFVHHAPDGQQFAFRGAYLEIDCPHRLVKSFVYEGKPEDEAIDTYTLRAGGRGNPGLAAQGSTRRSPRDALRVRRRAGPTSVRPSPWHRYRKEHPP